MAPFLSLLLALALSLPQTLATTLLPPTQDPWYTTPQAFTHTAPGTILRIRPSPDQNLTHTLGAAAAYNILYRTTDGLYNPSWAVTTVFLPSSPSTSSSSSSSLLSYQIWQDSASPDAAPSHQLSLPAGSKFHADIAAGLARGWAVNVPDYEGPRAAFAHGVQAGHATLDSLRAVLNVPTISHTTATTKIALWGFSGGSLASNWAAELAEQYAPELTAQLVGLAMGGLVPNGTSLFATCNGPPRGNGTAGLYPGLVASALVGWAGLEGGFRAWMERRLRREGLYNATGMWAAAKMTVDEAGVYYNGMDIGKYFLGGAGDLFGGEVGMVGARVALWGVHGVPRMPVYVYKAVRDELSGVGDSDRVVGRYCEAGANILYERNLVGGHTAEIANGKPYALRFLESVLGDAGPMEGFPAAGCVVRDVVHDSTEAAVVFG